MLLLSSSLDVQHYHTHVFASFLHVELVLFYISIIFSIGLLFLLFINNIKIVHRTYINIIYSQVTIFYININIFKSHNFLY